MRKARTPAVHDKIYRGWQRKRASLGIVILCNLSFCGAIMYHVFFVLGYKRSDNLAVLNFGLFLMLASAVSAANLQFMAWFYTLPNVMSYGSLLRMNRLIVRYPNLFVRISLWQCVFMSVLIFNTLFLVPTIKPELQLLMNNLQFTVGVLYLTGYIALLIFITITIEHIFRSSITAFGGTAEGDDSARRLGKVHRKEIKTLKKALMVVSTYRMQSITSGLVSIGLYITLLVTRFQYQHLFFNISLLILYTGLMFITATFLYTVLLSAFSGQTCLAKFHDL